MTINTDTDTLTHRHTLKSVSQYKKVLEWTYSFKFCFAFTDWSCLLLPFDRHLCPKIPKQKEGVKSINILGLECITVIAENVLVFCVIIVRFPFAFYICKYLQFVKDCMTQYFHISLWFYIALTDFCSQVGLAAYTLGIITHETYFTKNTHRTN